MSTICSKSEILLHTNSTRLLMIYVKWTDLVDIVFLKVDVALLVYMFLLGLVWASVDLELSKLVFVSAIFYHIQNSKDNYQKNRQTECTWQNYDYNIGIWLILILSSCFSGLFLYFCFLGLTYLISCNNDIKWFLIISLCF